MAKIDHVFVLMLENRSFDHILAFSGVQGVTPPAANFQFHDGAVDSLSNDPPHELDDVKQQVAGGTMMGFAQSGGADVMHGFSTGDLKVMTGLAQDFLLMDNWFSSIPGPTWPNRFFAHAASSGGLDNSPPSSEIGDAVFYRDHCFQFENGHIFDRLVAAGKSWRVYRGDRFPQVLSLPGMVEAAGIQNGTKFFRSNDALAGDLKKGDAATYTFIEPKYDPVFNFRSGNSQHPLGSVANGEALINSVYAALLNSPLWDSSLLLVTWDEHGGFFDHVTPPSATPPGDSPLNHDRAGSNKRDFGFDQFGVRVPALLISKWLPKGLGSTIFSNQIFDHSSIVASLRAQFDLGGPLTNRDAAAPTWTTELLSQARSERFVAAKMATTKRAAPNAIAATVMQPKQPVASIAGFAQIAMDVDWQLAKQTGQPPLFRSTHQEPLASTTMGLLPNTDAGPDAELAAHRILVRYIAAVDARVAAHEKANKAKIGRKKR